MTMPLPPGEISVEAPSTLVTSEAGTTATFRVFLNRAPTATVHLPVSSSDETEGKVSSSELVFQPGSWREPQTVTVLGLDDDATDGSQPYRVVLGAASSDDGQYQGIDPADLSAVNDDDYDFQPVAPTVVNGSTPCHRFVGGSQFLALDNAGVLYASMSCPTPDPPSLPPEGSTPYPESMWVAASADGGRTFGAPVDTRLPAFTAAIAASRPGLIVAAAGSWGRLAITRSEDGGVTWESIRILETTSPNSAPRVFLATAGERVLLKGGSSWWISEDGARTLSPFEGPGQPQAIGLDPDGTIWAIVYEPDHGLRFHTSRDGGATFQPGTVVPQYYDEASAAGLSMLYGAVYGTGNPSPDVPERSLVALRRDGLSMPNVLGILPMSDQYSYGLSADHKDNLTVGALVNGQIQAYRLNAGDSALGPARVLGPGDDGPSVLALSDRAVAILFGWMGKISVAVETWP
jgi:hypothetical protein